MQQYEFMYAKNNAPIITSFLNESKGSQITFKSPTDCWGIYPSEPIYDDVKDVQTGSLMAFSHSYTTVATEKITFGLNWYKTPQDDLDQFILSYATTVRNE